MGKIALPMQGAGCRKGLGHIHQCTGPWHQEEGTQQHSSPKPKSPSGQSRKCLMARGDCGNHCPLPPHNPDASSRASGPLVCSLKQERFVTDSQATRARGPLGVFYSSSPLEASETEVKRE